MTDQRPLACLWLKDDNELLMLLAFVGASGLSDNYFSDPNNYSLAIAETESSYSISITSDAGDFAPTFTSDFKATFDQIKHEIHGDLKVGIIDVERLWDNSENLQNIDFIASSHILGILKVIVV